MNIYKFIVKSLWHYRKQHLAVLLGTLLSTAVITGALVIGDSIHYSLQQLVNKRLGSVKYAMHTGDRYVRQQLIKDFSNNANIEATGGLILNGMAINSDVQKRINNIQVIGTDESFWSLSGMEMPKILEDEAILGDNVARKLNLSVNDEFLLRVENAGIIPVNAPFVAESNPSVSFRLKVKAIADVNQLGRFNLKNDQKAPNNIFVSHKYLADELELNGLINYRFVSLDTF